MSIIDQLTRMNANMDHEDHPLMVMGDTFNSSHMAFCFALGVENDNDLKFIVLGGNDSSLQAIRGLISVRTNRLFAGVANKEAYGYELNWRKRQIKIRDKFQFITTANKDGKKILIGFAENLQKEYVVSINKSRGKALQEYLQAPPYGLPILNEEWGESIYKYMEEKRMLHPVDLYLDKNEFKDITIAKVQLREKDSIDFLSSIIKECVVKFPEGKGNGEAMAKYDDLTPYLTDFSNAMLEDITSKDKPLHQPLEHNPLPCLDYYARELFPVQKHVVTGAVKALNSMAGILIHGEMSVGKSTIMTAVADAYNRNKGKEGYHACVMVPPTLTTQWANEEIKFLLPDAEVLLVKRAEDLIQYHEKWVKIGRPKPTKPTFFVVSFETMKQSSTIYSPIPKTLKTYKVKDKKGEERERVYKKGYYCPGCGQRLVTTKGTKEYDEIEQPNGKIKKVLRLTPGKTTDIVSLSSKTKATKECIRCGEQLFTYKVRTKRGSFLEWTKHEKDIIRAIEQGPKAVEQVMLKERMREHKARHDGRAFRKVATIDYIRRKMSRFFDISIVDEVHSAKGGDTAVGNAMGSLLSASKKFVCGTGTLFGGLAQDVFYTLYRCFPSRMKEMGFEYTDKAKWNECYGNVERTIYTPSEKQIALNKASRNSAEEGTKTKVVPGISPYVFSDFLLNTTINVRLKNVWPNPVELHNVPTIQCPIADGMEEVYKDLKQTFERLIDQYRGTSYQGQIYLRYIQTAVSYMDNPYSYPTVTMKHKELNKDIVLYEPPRISRAITTPKEKKLQDIVTREISENRPVMVFVNDTGSSNPDRDLQPRLKEVVERVEGAKAAILRSNTTDIHARTKWLREQIDAGVNVIICSTELVKVGLNLLFTPTIVFYQFSWSLFTLNQAARRHWRIGQTRECRTFYLATKDTMQEYVATIVARKNKSAEAMSGEATSDGLNALLGEDGDLQTMLIKGIKSGEDLSGTTEEWSAAASEETLRIMLNIGKRVDPVVEEVVETVTTIDLFTVSAELEQAVRDVGLAVVSLFEDVPADINTSWLEASTLFQIV